MAEIEFTVNDLMYAESLNITVAVDYNYNFGVMLVFEKSCYMQNGRIQHRRKKFISANTITSDYTLRDALDDFDTECKERFEKYLAEDVYHYEKTKPVFGTGSDGGSLKAP